jgi:hypothetical protein
MFIINDTKKELCESINGTVSVIKSFYDLEALKDSRYTLYAYVEITDDNLYVKFGEAKKQTIYARYHRGTATKANDRMIGIWESNKGDKEIHSKLKIRSKNNRGYYPADKTIINTEEAYYVEDVRGLNNLLNDISEYAGSTTASTRKHRTDYPDVTELIQSVVAMKKEKYIMDLCTRYGKTGFFCGLWKAINDLDIRINVLSSYVGTVKTSYSEELNTLVQNENCMFVDSDDIREDTLDTIKAWLVDPTHYVCYYVALTGDEDTCFERRIGLLDSLKGYNKSLVIEEADFGAGCDKQIKKIRHLYTTSSNNFKMFFATTGTKAEKCERIFEPEVVIKRDYILDILNKRPNAVGINWYCLNNSEMVKVFNYASAEMENFTDMFTLDNGKLRGELWFRDTFKFLFNKELPVINKETRKYRNHSLINDAVSMIFTPANNEAQQVLKVLLEECCPGYWVRVINGDEMTNATAEKEVKGAIRDQGTRGILIASSMANRSFSIPQIKNVLLMCNACMPDQKIARGLTPWAEHKELRCNVIDFRLAYEQTKLSCYLSNIAVDSLSNDATHTSIDQLLEEISASEKLSFYEYFSSGVNPIREIASDELRIQMHSRPFHVARALKLLMVDLNTIDLPDARFTIKEQLDFNDLASSNIKGDADKKIYINKSIKTTTGKSKKELEQDQRINYLAYLLNHKDEFNSGKYETNILENEFRNNMSEARRLAIENAFNIDMTVLTQIADLLINNGIAIYN